MAQNLFVGRIEPVQLEDEIQRSYLDYSMSVIVGRALPEVRDGLKPVHRRILWSMLLGVILAGVGWFMVDRTISVWHIGLWLILNVALWPILVHFFRNT